MSCITKTLLVLFTSTLACGQTMALEPDSPHRLALEAHRGTPVSPDLLAPVGTETVTLQARTAATGPTLLFL